MGYPLTVVIAALILIGPFASALRESQPLADSRPSYGQVVTSPDGEIFYQIHGGPGPTVFLAHGSGAWSQLWEETTAHLVGQGYQVVAFDMPPMGYSGPAKTQDYSRTAQSDRILALVDHIGGTPILVGHSFGAGPMTELAMRHPKRFKGLVIVSGALGIGSAQTPKALPWFIRPFWLRHDLVTLTSHNPLMTKLLLRQFVYRKDAITQRHVDILRQPLNVHGASDAFTHWVPSLFVSSTDDLSVWTKNYEALDLPVEMIWGEKDTVTPVSQAVEAQGLMANAGLIVLENVGHIPHIEAPAEFNATLISVLSNLTQPQ